MDWLRTLPVAHRGLHHAAKGIIENSPSAFEAAARVGYAIELDVHCSSDGEVIVFHDKELDRLTRQTGLVKERTAHELTQIQLDGGADTIPTLRDVLAQVRGRVPLLIEIKNSGRLVGGLEHRVAELLDGYKGEAAVQSFNPYSMGWFAKHAPHIRRGQISEGYRDEKEEVRLAPHERFALRHLLLSPVSRPNFIAYDCNALPAPGPRIAMALGLPVLSWTVRTPDIWDRIRPYVDNIIFEGFRPQIPATPESDG
jgi:glycerophosphoryl diester phosphodiesterase